MLLSYKNDFTLLLSIYLSLMGFNVRGQAYHHNVARVPPDTLRIDTAQPINFEKLLNISGALTLTSCEVVVSSKGEVFKQEYIGNGKGKWPQTITYFIKHMRKGDELIFDNIYVMKGDKKLRYPDKAFVKP